MPPKPKTKTPPASKKSLATKAKGNLAGVRRSRVPSGKRTVAGFTAAEASELFSHGGSSFAQWAVRKGVTPGTRKTAADWRPLLAEFAARPVHGHRRTAAGGTHTINKQHRR